MRQSSSSRRLVRWHRRYGAGHEIIFEIALPKFDEVTDSNSRRSVPSSHHHAKAGRGAAESSRRVAQANER